MIRAMLLIPVLVALSGVIGVVLCHAGHLDPHLHDLVLAAIVSAIVAEISLSPIVVFRNGPIATLAQAAFAGTVVHLMLSAILAIVLVLAMHLQSSFAYWMLLFYWTGLPVVSTLFIKALRSASPGPSSVTGNVIR